MQQAVLDPDLKSELVDQVALHPTVQQAEDAQQNATLRNLELFELDDTQAKDFEATAPKKPRWFKLREPPPPPESMDDAPVIPEINAGILSKLYFCWLVSHSLFEICSLCASLTLSPFVRVI